MFFCADGPGVDDVDASADGVDSQQGNYVHRWWYG